MGFASTLGSEVCLGIAFAVDFGSEICFDIGLALNFGGAIACLPGPVPASARGALQCPWPDHFHQTELPQICVPRQILAQDRSSAQESPSQFVC